ncbi:F0F1 ATP synthase subunit gamma [Vogesella oryzae]|uniref:F0F1 ATP synthase subunit gamma n=1 Tax=Vogesella oryzae TaxID=1735285 RepID=UPI001583BE3B|nr:FoF1 ATP synthase subunit gamma [Vogesella oryzae]
MSRRREIAQRLAALNDIAGILSAMKGLALMEVRLLTDFLASQHRMVAGIEAAASEFFATHPEFFTLDAPEQEFYLLVGAEQGFCGDFNEALLAQLPQAPLRCMVVGQRLAARLGARAAVEQVLAGATVADEVPAVLLRLTAVLGKLLTPSLQRGSGLSVLYHCANSGSIRLRRLLPIRGLPAPAATLPYAAELNLSPGAFLHRLTGHYLHAVLNEVLYSSLMAENYQRQIHMDSALQHLNEDSARLKLSYNLQRQEEITEEIEVILLSANMR